MVRKSHERFRTLPPFNASRPLRVVRYADGALGIVDEAHSRVWHGEDVTSTRDARPATEVVLPTIPNHYGKFVPKAIGGVSKTVRRVGCIRTHAKHRGALVVFATRLPSEDALVEALRPYGDDALACTVGDVERDDEYGLVCEVVVHEPADVDCVCAIIARCGATPILEDPSANALRGLGVERLDRIDAKVVLRDEDEEDENAAYGVRRGTDNWRFAWMPAEWRRVPITWDHQVDNFLHYDDLEALSQPLRQHVARERLRREMHDPMGSHWRRAETPPTARELAWAAEHPHETPPPPLRAILDCAPLARALAEYGANCVVAASDLESWGLWIDSVRVLVRDEGSDIWYRPRDTRNMLTMNIPGRRLVSAALTCEQSEQIITAFYLLSIERVPEPLLRRAAQLLLHRYMLERGYTSKYMGKYKQDALYIGNSNSFRHFRRLAQYAPDRLPAVVLNKLCARDGRLRNKGSKGSRSKYRTVGRYVPKRRLQRTLDDEERMIVEATEAS